MRIVEGLRRAEVIARPAVYGGCRPSNETTEVEKMTTRKIRFALSARFPESLKAWQDYARKVEDLGFDVLLIGDHMVKPPSELPGRSPMTRPAASASARHSRHG